MFVPAFMSISATVFFSVPLEVRGAAGANEGPEGAELLAGDRPMGGLRGELRPSVWGLGVLAHLLSHLQEPHPAATHHEHRSGMSL